MDLRFKHDKEVQIAARNLRQVKYTSDILKYLDTLQQLNMKVEMSGVIWRELFKEGLPDFILDLLPLTQGVEPQEDDALILCIKEHVFNYEPRQGEKKLAASASTCTSTFTGKKCKCSGGGTGATHESENSSAPPTKKKLTAGHAGNTGGGGKARIPRLPRMRWRLPSRGYSPLSEKPGTRETFVEDVALLVISGCSV